MFRPHQIDPLIKRLERDLRSHRQGSEKYMELRRELRNEKQRLKRQLKQKVRDEWTAEQAVDDIERQLQGVGFAKQAAADTAVFPQRPAQKRLMEALTAPLGNTLEGQYRHHFQSPQGCRSRFDLFPSIEGLKVQDSQPRSPRNAFDGILLDRDSEYDINLKN